MAEIKSFPFILSDESINRYGYRVLTDGISLENFTKNPIALWLHQRDSYEFGRDRLPIGRWENVRKEKGQLLADLVFDQEDEFALKIQSKVEQKIINAISIGFGSITVSDDKKYVIAGQRGPTVVSCELLEASPVDIPANANAIRLIDDTGVHTLSMELVTSYQPTPIKMKMNLLAAWGFILALLGLEPDKDHEVELSGEQLEKINNSGAELTTQVETLTAANETLTQERDAAIAAQASLQAQLDTANAELTTLRKAPGAASASSSRESDPPPGEQKELSATTDQAMRIYRPKK